MPTELDMYKEQLDKLEKLMMECVRLFDGYNATLMRKTGRAPSTLKGCIQQVLGSPPVPDGEGYVAGAKYAYKDCIDLIDMIADDTEVHLDKEKKPKMARELSTAYRKLGEGVIERMNIMLGGYNG